MMRWILAFAIVVSGLACASPQTEDRRPTVFDRKAIALVADLAAGRFDAIVDQFDATMKEGLRPSALASNWESYQRLVGTYQSHDAPTHVTRGDLTVERVPITTTSGRGEVRVTFRPDGTIAGLYFLRAGAPAP